MSTIGKPERVTQARVIALLRDELGYRFLGDWTDRANRHIEEDLLRDWLADRGHTTELTHFLEPTHNDRFQALVDGFLPSWRSVRQTLNRLPVRHEDWQY